MNRKGILLAGGGGNRLFPSTQAVNKQLLPIYDKPMIYYPLSTLMLAGLRDVVVISQPEVLPALRDLLGDGSQWGIALSYAAQPTPGGVAQAFLVAEAHIAGRSTCLVLGDNFLFGTGLPEQLRRVGADTEGATIFGYPVAHPEAFGVATIDARGRVLRLEEKPSHPQGNLAVPGLYFYDPAALSIAKGLKPSARGELEITDLNNVYLERGALKLAVIGRGSAWLDGGTPETLFEASQFVRIMEQRTGLKIACLEEVAYRMRYITLDNLDRQVRAMKRGSYREYLEGIVRDEAARAGLG